jgi:hypothetical protein
MASDAMLTVIAKERSKRLEPRKVSKGPAREAQIWSRQGDVQMATIKSTVCAATLVASFVTAQGCAFTEAYPNAKPLELNVYTAGDKEFYVTATLIHGGTEGVLIDTQFQLTRLKSL